MYLGDIYLKQSKIDSAILYIKGVPECVPVFIHNNALGYAAKIYLKAGSLDSAYMYALELVNSKYSTNKEIGYQVILSPQLKNFVTEKKIREYAGEYRTLIEDLYDENENQLALIQYSYYNYLNHEQKRLKTELSNSSLKVWLFGVSSLVLFLIIVIMILRNRSHRQLLEYNVALNNISLLKKKIDEIERMNTLSGTSSPGIENEDNKNATNKKYSEVDFTSSEPGIFELREKLKQELLQLSKRCDNSELSPLISHSKAYEQLQVRIFESKTIPENDSLWLELEEAVLKDSPDFVSNLKLLTWNKISKVELMTAILIKCHVNPTNMAFLLSRAKGTISSRRESLCVKLFGEKLGNAIFDNIIRGL